VPVTAGYGDRHSRERRPPIGVEYPVAVVVRPDVEFVPMLKYRQPGAVGSIRQHRAIPGVSPRRTENRSRQRRDYRPKPPTTDSSCLVNSPVSIGIALATAALTSGS
jgi:hypothetical protein